MMKNEYYQYMPLKQLSICKLYNNLRPSHFSLYRNQLKMNLRNLSIQLKIIFLEQKFGKLFKNYLHFFMYFIQEFSICIYNCMPEEGLGFHYRRLWATMCVQRIELRTYNHWTISPVSRKKISCKRIFHSKIKIMICYNKLNITQSKL